MGLFVDLIELDEQRTDDALEFLCKSHHDSDDGIWAPMDSPVLARIVELFTQRGLDRLDAFRVELAAWSAGHRSKPGKAVPRPDGFMQRWSEQEMELVRIYLEHAPAVTWTLDDHMLCIDYLAQRYLPASDMRREADWLSTRASMMGRVQANMAEAVTAKQADSLISAMPNTMQAAIDEFGATPVQRAVMDFAAHRCADNVVALADGARRSMRDIISEHVTAEQLGVQVVGGQSLETKLRDKFGALNRDWRRIAVTEAGEAMNQGYVASIAPGAKLKRVEQYKNACSFCRKIDKVVVTVVDPGKPNKNWDTEIWPGKNNIGRSASPRKRIGEVFREREPDEMWAVPAGLVHPHCRGRWVPVIDEKPGDDADFAKWMNETLTAPAKK